MAEEARYRLPRVVVPRRYDLTLEPDLDAATFSGSEDVQVEIRERLDEVVLNADDLVISSGWLERNGSRLGVVDVRIDAGTERAHVRLDGEADPGEWVLHLEFGGRLSDRMQGFYRSTYEGEDGGTRTVATTQFESTDARRAFPCWDEPDLKAVFGMSLVVRESDLAISNGPEVEREPLGDGRVRLRFADTMPMSTYLAAFVVGPMEATEPVDVDGVPLRVVHQPGKGHLTAYGLEVGAFCLRFFAEYYGIPYPDAKVDLVALPDFAQGAMENLGCITFRENLLLVDPEKATQPELAAVADVIAHELAHMWFGDLVTMRWWNGTWLNEAFATFMEILAVDAYRPDWERWTQFLRTRSQAFEIDALGSTRSIEYPVASPDDAAGMFDTLTYTKGAAVLRMLEQYLGAERFRDGIRKYLADHRFGNTETHELWEAIEAATGEPVRRIMDGWIWQGGYPMISADLEDGRVRLSQQRFLLSGESDEGAWDVPLLVRTGGETRPVLIEPEGASVAAPAEEPVIVNAGAHAFARVRYDAALLERVTASLEDLSADERTQLVDDAWASVVSGRTAASEFVRFADAFAGETELTVWSALLQGMSWCERFLDAGAARTPPDLGSRSGRPRARAHRMGATGGRARPHAFAPRNAAHGARGARRRSERPGAGPGDRARGALGRRRGSLPRRGLGGDRRRRGRAAGVRGVPPGPTDRCHAAGAAPLPLRAPGLPGRGARRSDPGARARRGRAAAERAVAVRPRDGQPGARRARLALREGPLGRDRGPVRAVDDRLRRRGRPVPDHARARRRRRRRSSPSNPIPQSALQLEQTLERQRVNAELRRRAAPDLRGVLLRHPLRAGTGPIRACGAEAWSPPAQAPRR